MTAETITCDCCEEEYEPEFFCSKCSNKVYEQPMEVPNLHWNGWPPEEEYEMAQVQIDTGDVCLNCCDCHRKP